MFKSLLTLIALALICSITCAQTGSQRVCAGFDSRLEVGDLARITPGVPNNVRSEPRASATRVGQIFQTDRFEVVGGPVCADDYTWWEIEMEDLEGWTAEGDDDEYWIIPLTERELNNPVINPDADDSLAALLAGIAFFVGGGPPGPYPCDDISVPSNGIAGYYTRLVGDDQIFDQVDRGSVVEINEFHDLAFGRIGICADFETAGILVSPDARGEAITLREYAGYYYYPLPNIIYIQPGNWTFQAENSGFNVDVDLEEAAIAFYDGDFWIVGFEPEEEIALVSLTGEFDDIGRLLSLTGVEINTIEADENGSLPLLDEYYDGALAAAVGEQGSFVMDSLILPMCDRESGVGSLFCQIKDDGDLAEYLYSLIWVEE